MIFPLSYRGGDLHVQILDQLGRHDRLFYKRRADYIQRLGLFDRL